MVYNLQASTSETHEGDGIRRRVNISLEKIFCKYATSTVGLRNHTNKQTNKSHQTSVISLSSRGRARSLGRLRNGTNSKVEVQTPFGGTKQSVSPWANHSKHTVARVIGSVRNAMVAEHKNSPEEGALYYRAYPRDDMYHLVKPTLELFDRNPKHSHAHSDT